MTTPFFHYSSNPDQGADQHHLTQISSFISPSPPFLFETQHHHEALQNHQEMMKGSTWRNDEDYGSGGMRRSSSTSSSDHPQKPVKWMSSKMRIMRKMIINSYQTPATKPRRSSSIINHHLQDHNNNNNKKANLDTNIIRVCSDCSTTKTPLWRSGPSGPKTLCNACGIRQRKARRAMAASSVKDNGGPPLEVDRTVPFKKRCRFAAAAAAAACVDQRKLCFEEIAIRLSKSSAFHRVFPQDEKDAAILLMALSCGLLSSS
ncbi:putative GATA transcription factor 22 [Platanthera zijinensis]|uniref:GATA transcription factor 22 n=1 Tax=Platanthera zijinensis TaxID=2320716 RepID=A0AAP0BGK9_9ASPA